MFVFDKDFLPLAVALIDVLQRFDRHATIGRRQDLTIIERRADATPQANVPHDVQSMYVQME